MKLLAPVLIVVIALLGAAYWDQSADHADVVIVNRGEVFTLDPQRMSYVQDFRLGYALYEGLVRWNNDDFSIQPAAAELPAVSDDGRTYTFHIRPNAKWSNGDPVTAHDFVYAFRRLLWPDTAADYSNLFFIIDGAEEFFHWRTNQLQNTAQGQAVEVLYTEAVKQFESTVGMRVVDDRTLEIRLRRPTAYVLDLLCFAVALPVHQPTVEGWPAAFTSESSGAEPPWEQRACVRLNPTTGRIEQDHRWARPGSLVGNGPYVLAQWRYKRDLRLERNPHYHSPEIMRNESVLMRSIEDANTAVLAFESGAVDWVVDVGAEFQSDMLQQGRRDVHAIPMFGTDFFNFNCRETLSDGRPNPFADARVRRAFSLAINRSEIVQTATRMNEPVMHTLIPPGSIPGYTGPSGLAENVEQARAELAAAGWRHKGVRDQGSGISDRSDDGSIVNDSGEPFPVVDLLYTSGSARYRWMCLTLAAQWERALGVRVELRAVDTKFYKDDLKQGKFMISRGRWYGDYGDPTTFLDINRIRDGNNDREYSNPRYDALLDAAAAEADPAKRMNMLADAERMLVEQDLPLLPVCQLVQVSMFDPDRVHGLSRHPRFVQYLWQIEAGHNAAEH